MKPNWIPYFLIIYLTVSCGALENDSSDGPGPKIKLERIDDEELTEPLSKEEECRQFRQDLPDDYEQGVVAVPADWDRPGTTIDVFYYGKRFDNGRTPIVFFNGGPSSSSHSSYEIMADKLIEAEQTMIYIDQRGTGCSARYPDPEFVSEGAFLASVAEISKWDSEAIVKDAEAVRKELFGEEQKWKVFGQSYGSLIVHRYIDTAAEGIHSAHAHGFALVDSSTFLHNERHMAQDRVSEMYLQEYPEDRERIRTLHRFVKDRCYLPEGYDEEDQVCGKATLDPAYSYLAFRSQWQNVHEVLEKIAPASVDPERLKRLVRLFHFEASHGDYDHFGGGAINFREISTNEFDADDITGCKKAIEYARRNGKSLDEWEFSECRLKLASLSDLDSESKQLFERLFHAIPKNTLRVSDIKTKLEATAIPFFLYSGRLDGLVPPPIFKQEVEALGPLVSYTEFAETGHDGFYTEDQVWEDLFVE